MIKLAVRWRICLGVVIFIATLCLVPYLFVLSVFGAVFPPIVALPLSVLFSAALACLSVSLGSPASLRGKLQIGVAVVMLALWITALSLSVEWRRREFWWVLFLGGVGVVGVTLWSMPRGARIAGPRVWAGAFLIVFVALLGVTLVDWPVWPDAVPGPLLEATNGNRDAVERFHCYYLGGFIDHDWLWRIDARPEVLQAIVPKLGLRRVTDAPPGFWGMWPYYWPKSLPAGAELYSSPGFSHGAGDQYFMLIDASHGLAVVWVRSLFG